jgi:uncharacterized protein (UPF0333 family)
MNENQVSLIVIILFISLLLALIMRELVCWYFKINKHIKNQEKIIELLSSINQSASQNINKEKNTQEVYNENYIYSKLDIGNWFSSYLDKLGIWFKTFLSYWKN